MQGSGGRKNNSYPNSIGVAETNNYENLYSERRRDLNINPPSLEDLKIYEFCSTEIGSALTSTVLLLATSSTNSSDCLLDLYLSITN